MCAMALKETIPQLQHILSQLMRDLAKASNGNKTAAQRVRTGTIHLQKIAKVFRKESVASEKGTPPKRKAKARPLKRRKKH